MISFFSAGTIEVVDADGDPGARGVAEAEVLQPVEEQRGRARGRSA